MKALHLHLGQEAWGHVVARLLQELPMQLPSDLVDRGRVLDTFYIPARYPNSHPEGAPFEQYGRSRARRRSSMPVRSLTSSVLRWPSPEEVRAAIRAWATGVTARTGVMRVGCFGSLPQARWGVGSDADLVVIVDASDEPMYRRALGFDASTLPVPADLLVYTGEEWDRLTEGGRDPFGPIEWFA